MSASPITGYRTLTPEEVALMNEGKALGITIGAFIAKLEALPKAWVPSDDSDISAPPGVAAAVDPRWLAIGTADLQKGLMSLLRSIARPTSF